MKDIHEVCTAYHDAIELIGSRWTGAVIQAVLTDHHRFGDIRAAVPGISDTMLAQRLHEMEEAGIIERHIVSDDGPVRNEYFATEKGRDLESVVTAIGDWAHKWIQVPEGAAEPHDV